MDNKSKNIYITTNTTCNLRCTYCYEDKTESKEFDVKTAKSMLHKMLSVPSDNPFIINFHGGEPFLVFDKIAELCEWVWNQNYKNQITFFATTNGTKVHGKIQEWLTSNKERFIAGLSFDGTREMQNMNRSNSFDLIDIDYFVKTWPDQSVKMTISPKSIETLADGVIFLHSVGFQHIIANLAYMVDWNKPHFARIYQRELQKLSHFYKEHPEINKCTIFDLKLSQIMSDNARTNRWCGAGVENSAYDIDGSVYPCHLFFENVCGKEKSQAWHNIDFSDPNQYISDECSKCQLYPTCPTCYGANYIERGSIGSRDMSLCRLEKIRTLEVAKFEYASIVNSSESTDSLSAKELNKRMKTLDAIEKLLPLFNEIENELKQTSIDG